MEETQIIACLQIAKLTQSLVSSKNSDYYHFLNQTAKVTSFSLGQRLLYFLRVAFTRLEEILDQTLRKLPNSPI